MSTRLISISPAGNRQLTATQFHQLANVPAETEWFANLDNPRTRRAYQGDLQDFMAFAGIQRPKEFRIITRAHVLAWRKLLEDRALSGATIRRKLAALSSLCLSGDFCPVILSLFHGMRGTWLTIVVSMTTLLTSEGRSSVLQPLTGVTRPTAAGNP